MRLRLLVLLAFTLLPVAGPARAAFLDELRAVALAAVNADRAAHDLAPLAPDPALEAAAQRHADDMRRRGYFEHVSPEGRTAMDRYRAAGGERWRKVGENIARCEGCGPPDGAAMRRFQRGWMDSPEHRRNILDPGFRHFGFGLSASGGEQRAVQTFSGPGMAEDEAAALSPQGQEALAAELANASRAGAGVPTLERSAALSEAALGFLDRRLPDGGLEGSAQALMGVLGPGWREIAVLVGECGGCGSQPTGDDVRRFVRGWLDEPSYRERLLARGFRQLGFALWTDGQGRKVALALLGRP